MKLTPDAILTRVFSNNVLGGYDKKEVTLYLEQLAHQFSETLKEQMLLKEQILEKERQLNEFRDREDLLRTTITAASKTASKMCEDAAGQASAIVAEAHEKADIIAQDARDSLRTVYQDLSDLRRVHIQLKNTLKAVLQSHQDLLEQDPIHTLLPQSRIDEDEIESKVSQALDQLSRAKDLL